MLMGLWLSWIKSNEKELLTILDNLAKKAVETSEAVLVLFSDLNNPEHTAKIHKLETEADVLTRDIFTELNKTFTKIDDVIDFMDGIAARVYSYKIITLPPYCEQMAQELVKATKEVEYMVSKLKHIKNTKDMIEHCRNTSDIEHVVDDLYKEAIKELFESDDAIKIIKLKDIYETMETASDRCVDVADVIEDIVLKYT
jgi:uncharacterized protein Yka (UPF0111/DUF47 family)